jgi:hypothetical protein
MSTQGKQPAMYLANMISEQNETQTYVTLEQLMLFPLDIQDVIIEEISHLSHCNNDAVNLILNNYINQ